VRPAAPLEVRFDRGTIELRACAGAGEPPPGVWDPRSASHRVAAYRFGELVARAGGAPIEGDLRPAWAARPRDAGALALRSYQQQALASWTAFGRRGVVVLPTGAGKTRVAIAAVLETGLPTAVLCPTRALAAAWIQELERCLGEPIGLIGDGTRQVERVTVLTFESAFRHMDGLGDRFGLLVVDEVHHFGSGARTEALEASPAIARLGLTATAPERASEQAARLVDLVGPVVFELGYRDLVGKHLAPLELVRVPVRLEPDERALYEARTRAFRELRRAYLASYPGADIVALMRGLGRSPEGARALREHARAQELASFPRAKRALVRLMLERHRDDRTVVFTAFAENAYAVAVDNLIPVVAAETSARERKDILARFRDGRLRAVASARVLNEGIDVPEARVAILVAGAQGEREYVQRIGRVLRPAPHKRALVYELLTTGTTEARRASARARHAPWATA
jgi:superfamily II DNA or RNA helicase